MLALAGLTLPAPLLASGLNLCRPDRQLSFFNTHTGESLNCVTYWANGGILQDALPGIYNILRDHRSGEIAAIDLDLLDQLTRLNHQLDSSEPIHIISAYRSPLTNSLLRRQSDGVAKRSYHMQGRAIDIRIPGRGIDEVYQAAMSLKMGGVGFYPESDFIHLDTARHRTWRG